MHLLRRYGKRAVVKTLPVFVSFLKLFFQAQYLRGRFFDSDVRGVVWSFRSLWARNILRLAPPLPFPAALTATITHWRNIDFDPEDINNFQSPGVYFQCSSARIRLGKGVFIGPNVGLITANHDLKDLGRHRKGDDIVIGPQSWIGMNSVILPGVTLGPNTIVAAGSVVNKSFPQGECLLAGAPAKIVRTLPQHELGAQEPDLDV
jgi:transferase family hexapeptide repeat protein